MSLGCPSTLPPACFPFNSSARASSNRTCPAPQWLHSSPPPPHLPQFCLRCSPPFPKRPICHSAEASLMFQNVHLLWFCWSCPVWFPTLLPASAAMQLLIPEPYTPTRLSFPTDAQLGLLNFQKPQCSCCSSEQSFHIPIYPRDSTSASDFYIHQFQLHGIVKLGPPHFHGSQFP